jgi:ABC-type bacteriocin/lantibiotic exporter with double-glycine peptidase domain
MGRAAFCRFAIYLVFCEAMFAAAPGVWLDVPFIQQQSEGCGSASIAMVMQYWQKQQGQPVATESSEPTIFRALYSEKDHGILASSLEGYLRDHGFRTFAFHGTWEDLQHHLQQGRPLIAALKPMGSSALHYVVVTGLDSDRKLVVVNDPAQRKLLKQERAKFEQQWHSTGNWTLLAVPQSSSH